MSQQTPYYNSKDELVVEVTIPFQIAKFIHDQSVSNGVSSQELVSRYFLERVAQENPKFNLDLYLEDKKRGEGSK